MHPKTTWKHPERSTDTIFTSLFSYYLPIKTYFHKPLMKIQVFSHLYFILNPIKSSKRISQCFLHVNFAHFALFFACKFDAFRTVFFCIKQKPLAPRSNRNPPVYRWKWGFWDGPGTNMKKVGLTDTVSFEISRRFRVARVKLCVFPGAKIAGKKDKNL